MPDPLVAVFDACVLYPFHLRNIVVRIAVDRLVDARWTDAIHDEWIRNLGAGMPDIPVARLRTTRALMNAALPDATVTGYEAHLTKIVLPDAADRHLVAAAIAAGASVILTWNLRDFPIGELKKHGLIRQTPDGLLTELYDQAPDVVRASLGNARRNLSKTRVSAVGFIDILKNQKLTQLAKRIGRRTAGL